VSFTTFLTFIGITILYSGSLIRIGSGTFATLGTFARLFILGGGAKDAQRMKDENPLHLPWLLSSLGVGGRNQSLPNPHCNVILDDLDDLDDFSSSILDGGHLGSYKIS